MMLPDDPKAAERAGTREVRTDLGLLRWMALVQSAAVSPLILFFAWLTFLLVTTGCWNSDPNILFTFQHYRALMVQLITPLFIISGTSTIWFYFFLDETNDNDFAEFLFTWFVVAFKRIRTVMKHVTSILLILITLGVVSFNILQAPTNLPTQVFLAIKTDYGTVNLVDGFTFADMGANLTCGSGGCHGNVYLTFSESHQQMQPGDRDRIVLLSAAAPRLDGEVQVWRRESRGLEAELRQPGLSCVNCVTHSTRCRSSCAVSGAALCSTSCTRYPARLPPGTRIQPPTSQEMVTLVSLVKVTDRLTPPLEVGSSLQVEIHCPNSHTVRSGADQGCRGGARQCATSSLTCTGSQDGWHLHTPPHCRPCSNSSHCRQLGLGTGAVCLPGGVCTGPGYCHTYPGPGPGPLTAVQSPGSGQLEPLSQLGAPPTPLLKGDRLPAEAVCHNTHFAPSGLLLRPCKHPANISDTQTIGKEDIWKMKTNVSDAKFLKVWGSRNHNSPVKFVAQCAPAEVECESGGAWRLDIPPACTRCSSHAHCLARDTHTPVCLADGRCVGQTGK